MGQRCEDLNWKIPRSFSTVLVQERNRGWERAICCCPAVLQALPLAHFSSKRLMLSFEKPFFFLPFYFFFFFFFFQNIFRIVLKYFLYVFPTEFLQSFAILINNLNVPLKQLITHRPNTRWGPRAQSRPAAAGGAAWLP